MKGFTENFADWFLPCLTNWPAFDLYTPFSLLLGFVGLLLAHGARYMSAEEGERLLELAFQELVQRIRELVYEEPVRLITTVSILDLTKTIQSSRGCHVITEKMISHALRTVILHVEDDFSGQKCLDRLLILNRIVEEIYQRKQRFTVIASADISISYRYSISHAIIATFLLQLLLVIFLPLIRLHTPAFIHVLIEGFIWLLALGQFWIALLNERATRYFRSRTLGHVPTFSLTKLCSPIYSIPLIDFFAHQARSYNKLYVLLWGKIWETMEFGMGTALKLSFLALVTMLMGYWSFHAEDCTPLKLGFAAAFALGLLVMATELVITILRSRPHTYLAMRTSELYRELNGLASPEDLALVEQGMKVLAYDVLESYHQKCRELWAITGEPIVKSRERRVRELL